MHRLTLHDSSDCYPEYDGGRVGYHQHPEALIRAVDELNRRMSDGELKVISLNQYSPRVKFDCPVSYKILGYTTFHNRVVVDECCFYASHYIGRFSYGDVEIEIVPRFGRNSEVFNYLLSCATNVFLPRNDAGQGRGDDKSPEWLMAVVWKGMLNKALTDGQIPKDYITVSRNQKFYKGRLNINKHIRENITDGSRFFCTYKRLTFNSIINRTIRAVYSIFKQRCPAVVADLEAYDQRLASMGVDKDASPFDISKIRYSGMTFPYRPVMELSKTVLEQEMSLLQDKNSSDGYSYFVDVAELWEMYLLRLLQRELTDYLVYSPNEGAGDYLIADEMRQIRPDIIIEKSGSVVAVIDAKYKRYDCLGSTAVHGVGRDDLYQMATYLYHYGSPDRKICGIFTAPVGCVSGDVHQLTHNGMHSIGLINLAIDRCLTIDDVYAAEDAYIRDIKEILCDKLK